MTTRTNAYAYIWNVKQLPSPNRYESSFRALRWGASPAAALQRLRRKLHTTRTNSAAAVFGNNKAKPGGSHMRPIDGAENIQFGLHLGRGITNTIESRPDLARTHPIEHSQTSANSSQESNHSTKPNHSDVLHQQENPKPSVDSDLDLFLSQAEFEIFGLLRYKQLVHLTFPTKRKLETGVKYVAECSFDKMPNKITARGKGSNNETAKKAAKNKLISKLRESGVWKDLQDDLYIKRALSGKLPDPTPSVKLNAQEYSRFLKMKQDGRFQLTEMSVENTNGHAIRVMELTMPGQPELRAPLENIRKFHSLSVRASRTSAYLILIAKMQLAGIWDIIIPTEKVTQARDEFPDAVSKTQALPRAEARASSEDQALTQGECLPQEQTPADAMPQDDSQSKDQGSPQDAHVPHNEVPQQDEVLLEKEIISSRGNAHLILDDDLLATMGMSRNDLLKTSKMVRKMIPEQKAFSPEPQYFNFHLDEDKRQMQLAAALKQLRESKDPKMLEIRSKVAALPIADFRQSILDLVKSHTFSIIVAETGSGKSTQVPQIILDDAIDQGDGGRCNIICTQPRRIAAQRLADRVSQERDETVGQTVGSIVRFERRLSRKDSAITFCTTGILLNYLQSVPDLVKTFSHIILDEVHVRDIGIDFVMLLLKRFVNHCSNSGADIPKIVVMSATVDTNLFSSYFSMEGPDGSLIPAPHITVPGRQYQVDHYYLDEILGNLETSPLGEELNAVDDADTAKYLHRHLSEFGDIDSEAGPSEESPDKKSTPLPHSSKVPNALPEEDSLVPAGLLGMTVFDLLSRTESGSIMVFLPGLKPMTDLKKKLQQYGPQLGFDFSNEEMYRVILLHSHLPEEQEKLSLNIPTGCRRVIISTDIAEASVTISDVKYVIDAGKVNQLIVNTKNHSRRLACCWATQSQSQQRAGRAGRVQAGEYYYLGTKKRYDTLRVEQIPEIIRGNLQTTCLRARLLSGDDTILGFLKELIEPPKDEDVIVNVDALKQLSALDDGENFTSLGSILAKLPTDTPAMGKLIMLGIIFRCLDPMLALAATGSTTPLFLRSTDTATAKLVLRNRVEFASGSGSDHISAINAFKSVRKVFDEQGKISALDFAMDHSIWYRSWRTAHRISEQILGDLRSAALIPPREDKWDSEGQLGGARLNVNSNNTPLIKALLLHCLFPRLAGPRDNSNEFTTNTDPRTMMAARSVFMAGIKSRKQGQKLPKCLVVYDYKASSLSGMPFIHEISPVSPLTAAFFGGKLRWDAKEMLLDSWLSLSLNTQDSAFKPSEAARNLIELHKALRVTLDTAFDTFPAANQRSPSKSHPAMPSGPIIPFPQKRSRI
ncbi:hypothetical protein N7532_009136 [Penicillium argentinense]|uniref:P-loop containing nucleoside triphosphate hydrolase protein n=1 Tax=Penicillium argentinense TaxID=1131581 RepID=A0A9W9K369_9EURO|nr:uncharacterized protein N7532_009136 [Penicillium argentinense]KAJ5090452.1 hypothetical protein N7532_009136 [Penicillium argentinense]